MNDPRRAGYLLYSLVYFAKIGYLVGMEDEVGALANELFGLVTEDVQY